MMSIIGVPMLMAPIVGPILGGWLVDGPGWQWIFYVNVPIGIATLFAAYRILPSDVSAPHERLDWKGLVLLSPGLTAFVYGLAEVSSSGGITATKAWLPMAAGLVLVAAFALHAFRIDYALLDLHLIRDKVIMRASAMTTMLFAGAFFATMFLIPLYYQIVRDQSALNTGLLLAPQGLAAAFAMPLAGKYTDSHGAGRVVLFGLGLIVAGLFGFTHVGVDTSLWLLAGFQGLLGLGMGSSMMPAMAAAYQQMTRDQVARATTALNIIQRVGGAIGIALLSVVLSHRLAAVLPPAAGGGDGGLSSAQALPPGARAQFLPTVADAFGHTFWWAVGFAILAAIPALWLPRHQTVASVAPQH
jgi:EmrB/QacA subfamily drug resistance transporter